jgi:hypothetical protein
MKDTWWECHRPAKSEHYDTLREGRKDDTPLAECKGSVDLGEEKGAGFRTCSAKFHGKPMCERTCNRLLLYPVGYSLTKFKSTHSLVKGIRDAAKGKVP